MLKLEVSNDLSLFLLSFLIMTPLLPVGKEEILIHEALAKVVILVGKYRVFFYFVPGQGVNMINLGYHNILLLLLWPPGCHLFSLLSLSVSSPILSLKIKTKPLSQA